MSPTAFPWIAAAVATLAACWSGMLAAAEESAAVSHTLGDAPSPVRGSVPVDRALVIGRIALLLIAGVAGAQAVGWLHRPTPQAFAVGAVAAGFLYMLGEAIPRAAASLSPRMAAAAVPLARRSLLVFGPLLGLMSWIERRVQIVLPPRVRDAGLYGRARRDMVDGVLSLSETTVAEAMTPRLDVMAVDSASTWPELAELLRKSEHARIPVYTADLDNIVGILDAKDLASAIAGTAPPPDNWLDLVYPASFVPESKTLSQQLADFQGGPAHVAIVVDEFGGTSGLITREDVLEEIVGDIYDEYDVNEQPSILREGDDRLWVDGGVTIDDLASELGTAFPQEDVSTVGGLVYSELGRVPMPGEELHIANFRVVVEQVFRRRIKRVYFERTPDSVLTKHEPEAAP